MSFVQNKTVVLSGASMGIGRAAAVELAREGARLVINARTREKLEETRRLCVEVAPDAVVTLVAGDAADEDVASNMAAAASELGGCACLVHAAGVLAPGPTLWELSREQFRQVFGASVDGLHALLRHLTPQLLEAEEAALVVFGSGAAQIAQPGIAAYCAAKAAEESLAKQMMSEAPDVNTVIFRPGVVETRMQVQARESEGGSAKRLRKTFEGFRDRGELITPEESAQWLMKVLRDPAQHEGQTVRAGGF